MNLQEALNLAQTTCVAKESILHIGKGAKNQYELLIVTYVDEEQWFVIYYQSGSLRLNGSLEQDSFSGADLEELTADISKDIDISALRFHTYPIGPGHFIDMEMPYVLNKLFPESIPNPDTITDPSHYQRLVDKYLSTL